MGQFLADRFLTVIDWRIKNESLSSSTLGTCGHRSPTSLPLESTAQASRRTSVKDLRSRCDCFIARFRVVMTPYDDRELDVVEVGRLPLALRNAAFRRMTSRAARARPAPAPRPPAPALSINLRRLLSRSVLQCHTRCDMLTDGGPITLSVFLVSRAEN
ncbi:hypothetical protein EVAR_65899_1 [Eumeta japonica]|uniref:Uncharacterized protein n=1 Tax=Eumeta variegata TaxID=151549 RepID=A0A4C2A6M1_EUMVA|nr:hypothetical protein EVAR_65899_1 [Eumeta japonica]